MQARALTPVRAVALPAETFERALAESEGFRRFAFRNFSQVLTRVLRRTGE